MPAAAPASHPRLAALAPAELGLVGQVATSWALAGGLVAALVVAGHMVAERLSSSLGFLTMTLFYTAGSIIAFLHGSILAYLGRPPEVSRRRTLRRLGLGGLYAAPILLAGWVVALGLGLSAVAVRSGRLGLVAVSLTGWILTVAALVWAWVETRRALQNLYRRWPAGQAIVVALGLAFLALLPVFLVTRPEIWIVGVRPTPTAATFMALAATLWIGGPLTALGALAIRAWTRHHPERPRAS